MKQYIIQKLKFIPLLMLLGALSVGLWIFALRMLDRNSGNYAQGRRYVVESNWGENITQNAPALNTQVFYEGDVAIKLNPNGNQVQQSIAKNVRIIKSDINAILNMDYRRKGLIYFPTYVTDFTGTYIIKNENKEKVGANLQFPLPASGSLVWNVEILADDSAEGAVISTKELAWQGDVKPNEEKKIVVKYSARGLDDFSYTLADNYGLQDFDLNIQVNGAERVDFPQGAISPSSVVEKETGWDLNWEFKKVLTSPSITVKLFAKENISSQVAKLFWFAPFLLVAYLVSIFGLSFLQKKDLGVFDLGLLSALYFIFYPFMAYLVSVVDSLTILQGLGISFALIALISSILYQFIFGVKFALSKGLLVQGIFLGFFPFALLIPELSGFLGIVGVIVLLTVLVFLRMEYGKK